jgi:hypothetical protein
MRRTGQFYRLIVISPTVSVSYAGQRVTVQTGKRGKSPGELPDCRRGGRAKALEMLGLGITTRLMPTCMPGGFAPRTPTGLPVASASRRHRRRPQHLTVRPPGLARDLGQLTQHRLDVLVRLTAEP